MNSKWRYNLSIFIPILIFAAWAAQYTYMAASGPKVRLNITGYDPRDLLAGHYLNYTVEFGPKYSCDNMSNSTLCVCLETNPENGISTASWAGSCLEREKQENCQNWIQVQCRYGTTITNINRYYFSEVHQKDLVIAPMNSSIEIALNGRGQAVVTNFYVNDKTLDIYLKENNK